MLNALLISVLSVTFPLIIGGFLSTLIKRKNENCLNFLTFVSLGTLIFLICYEIFPNIFEISNGFSNFGFIYSIISILIFLLLILVVHKCLDILVYKHKHNHRCHHEHDHGHIDVYLEKRKESLKKAGFALCIALFFHNFPEGMSLGIEIKEELSHGISLGISLAIHNLVMGLTMALPLLLSNMKRRNIFILLTLSSIPCILGTIVGYSIANENQIVNMLLLSFSLSVLIFVICEEFKTVIHKSFKWYYIIAIILGIVLSFFISMLDIH